MKPPRYIIVNRPVHDIARGNAFPAMVAGVSAPVIVDSNDFVTFIDSISYATIIVLHWNTL